MGEAPPASSGLSHARQHRTAAASAGSRNRDPARTTQDHARPTLIAFALCAGAAIFVLWPMFGAPFGPNDDYQLAQMIGRDHVLPLSDLPRLATTLVVHDVGRFRPAYYPIRTAEAALFEENTAAWHLSRFVLLLVSTGLLIILLRGLVPTAGLVLLPMLLFAGGQAEVWIWLAPNEAYGIPLLLGGLAAWRAGYRWPAVALLLIAGLTKESFALFNVGIAAWLAWRHRSLPVAVLVAGTFVTVSAIGLTYLGGEALYSSGRTIDLIQMTFATFIWMTGMGALVAAALVPTRRVLWTVVGAFVLLAPQVFITGASGVLLPGRYLLPGALVFVAVGAAVLASPSSRRKSLATAVLAVTVAIGLVGARTMADERAVDAHRMQTAVDRIASFRAEHPDRLIVFAPNRGRWEYEWYAALGIYVDFAGVSLDPAVTKRPTEPPLNEFESTLERWVMTFAPAGEATAPCLSVQAVGSSPVCDEVLTFYFP